MKTATIRHSIDGRIRLKVDKLKGNTEESKRITNGLYHLDGILDVKVNEITGSIIIHFDENIINSDLILGYLHKQKVFEKIVWTDNTIDNKKVNNTDTEFSSNVIAKTILLKALEIAAERAVMALL